MSTGRRALREIEDVESKLKRIIRSIDAGNGDLQEIRTALQRIVSGELSDAERLVRRIRDAD
jgi:hypothetical protein